MSIRQFDNSLELEYNNTMGVKRKYKLLALVGVIATCGIIITYPFFSGKIAGFSTTQQPIASTQKNKILKKQVQPNTANSSTKTPVTTTTAQDPDPMVTCNTKHLGSFQITQSECDKLIECEIAGKWYIASSEQECKSNQELYAKAMRSYTSGTSTGYVPNINLRAAPSIKPFVTQPLPSTEPIQVNHGCTGNNCWPNSAPSVPWGFSNY